MPSQTLGQALRLARTGESKRLRSAACRMHREVASGTPCHSDGGLLGQAYRDIEGWLPGDRGYTTDEWIRAVYEEREVAHNCAGVYFSRIVEEIDAAARRKAKHKRFLRQSSLEYLAAQGLRCDAMRAAGVDYDRAMATHGCVNVNGRLEAQYHLDGYKNLGQPVSVLAVWWFDCFSVDGGVVEGGVTTWTFGDGSSLIAGHVDGRYVNFRVEPP